MSMKHAGSNPESDAKIIAEVRRFNRLYTRQLGLLDRHLLDSAFTLTQARVLYELAQCKSTIATKMAADLGLDLGYLSRILKMFERHRYIKRERASADTRQYHISLTALGRRRFLPLDRAARTQVATLITPLAAARRHELVESMRAVGDLLTGRVVEPKVCELRGLRPGDIGWIAHRQGILYQQEYGWDISYEALVAEILAGFVKAFDPRSESAWIAEQHQKIVGSVLLVRASSNIAKLRLLYVEPSARGMGIGRRLVDECIAFARAQGYETLTLWTNNVLVSARRIYQAAGFRLIAEESHRSFGHELVGQTWTLEL